MPRPKKSNRADGRYQIARVVGYEYDGTPIKKSFYGKTKDEALRKYQDFLEEKERKQEAKKHTDFASWVNEWLYTYKEPNVKPSTFGSTYERPCRLQIIPFFEGKEIQEITNADIRRFANSIRDLSQSRINMALLCLRNIFETAIDNDLIAKNPCKNITCKSKQEKQVKRTYDENSVERLCESDHKYSIYVHILLRMGLRCSELCGLRWKDIDLEKGTISITQALTVDNWRVFIDVPKSKNSVRRLNVPEDLLSRLRSVKEEDREEYLAMKDGKHITPAHFGDVILRPFYEHEGVPANERLSAHELRHTCGTLMYEQTKDIYHVSRFLGHSDINITTKTYVHSEMQEQKIHINFA